MAQKVLPSCQLLAEAGSGASGLPEVVVLLREVREGVLQLLFRLHGEWADSAPARPVRGHVLPDARGSSDQDELNVSWDCVQSSCGLAGCGCCCVADPLNRVHPE